MYLSNFNVHLFLMFLYVHLGDTTISHIYFTLKCGRTNLLSVHPKVTTLR